MKSIVAVTASLIIYYLFSYQTILGGHGWGDDFALYILHAKNISSGIPYAETGYIYNPLAPTYAPQSYPPGFPILLAPVYKFFGLDFIAFKVEMLIFYLFFLFFIYLFFKGKTQDRYLVILLLVMAFNPFLWNFRNEILSDIPAAALLMLSLWVYEKAAEKKSSLIYLLLGVCIFFATIVRSTGICLLFTFVAFELIKTRKISKGLILAFLVMTFLLIITNLLFQAGNSYIGIVLHQYQNQNFGESLNSILIKINKYMLSFKEFTILKPYDNTFFTILFYITFFTAIAGYLYKIKKAAGISELFVFFYTAVILLWPEYQGIRFFIPLLPLYIFYFFYMLTVIKYKKPILIITIAFFVATIFANMHFFNHIPRGQTPYGIQETPNQEVFNFIKNNTEDSSVIMSTKPRAFTLFTQRKGIVFPDKKNAALLYKNLNEYDVDYIVTGSIDYWPYIKDFIHGNPQKFSLLFDNNSLQVFKVNNP